MPVKIITKIVAYYRLSKPKKGKNKAETIRDAYGLEDQRREVAKIAAQYGAKIIGEFTEIVTGTKKKPHREELEKAIHMARMHSATIVIGKQDRLARNVALISSLLESGVHFICADRPDQSKFEIHIRASVDEEEADRISDRTKRAMQVAKEEGKLLGSARPGHWRGREHLRGYKQATAASSVARAQRARDHYRYIIDMIVEWNKDGVPMDVIAERLNELGHVTSARKPFQKVVIYRVFKLFGKKPRPEEFFTGECKECGRKFRVSWKQREAKRTDGAPYICYRCVKELAST